MDRGSNPASRALPEASGRGVGDGPVQPTGMAIGCLHPLGLGEIVLAEGHELGDWQRRNSTKTLPHCVDRVVASGAVRNLERVAQGRGGEVPHEGWHFSDSDVYKVLEAAAWDGVRGLSAEVEGFVEEAAAVVAEIEAAAVRAGARCRAPSAFASARTGWCQATLPPASGCRRTWPARPGCVCALRQGHPRRRQRRAGSAAGPGAYP